MILEEIFRLSEWLGLWAGIIGTAMTFLAWIFNGPWQIFMTIAGIAFMLTGYSMIKREAPIKKEKPE